MKRETYNTPCLYLYTMIKQVLVTRSALTRLTREAFIPYMGNPLCTLVILKVHIILYRGPSTKDVRQMGRGGVVLKFRTFPDGGRGVVCESSDVRKFLKKSKFQNFSELFKVKTRNYKRSRFQYESIHI